MFKIKFLEVNAVMVHGANCDGEICYLGWWKNILYWNGF